MMFFFLPFLKTSTPTDRNGSSDPRSSTSVAYGSTNVNHTSVKVFASFRFLLRSFISCTNFSCSS